MLGSGLWRNGGRLILLPLLATIAACGLVFAIVSAAFAANADRTPPPTPPAAAPVPNTGGPTFEVATASSDEPVVMADFLKAADANTSFGRMLIHELKTSPRVSDFGSLEHEYSPKMAKHKVNSGDAVLAVIIGRDFTSAFHRNMLSALRGGKVHALPLTIIAGPQALADKKLILREYREQALKPTLDYIADEMRIVVRKSGCDRPGTDRCVHVTSAMLDKFADPFHAKVVTVAGPAPKTYDYPSTHDSSAGDKEAARDAAPNHAAQQPTSPHPEARPAPAVPTPNALSMVMVLIVTAGLIAATTTAWAVDHRVGLSVFTTGPWRRQNAAMPFPRRKAIVVKNIAGGVVGAAASSLLIGIYLAESGRLGASEPAIVGGNCVLWAFAVLLTWAVVALVHALQAVIGTPGWLVGVLAVLGFGLPAAGIGRLLAGEADAAGALTHAASGLIYPTSMSGLVEVSMPAVATLLSTLVVSCAIGIAVSGAYDKYVTSAVR